MKNFCLLIIIWLFMLIPIGVSAASTDDIGTRTGSFLKLGAGARAIGMGECGGSVTDDSSVLYWNPAGLSGLSLVSLTLMHSVYIESVYYDYASFAVPSSFGTFGVGVQYLSVGAIDETEDITAIKLGTYEPNDLSVTIGYANSIGAYDHYLGFGVAAKYIKMEIKNSASTMVCDAGLNYKCGRLNIGVVEQNYGGLIKFNTVEEKLYENLKISVAYTFAKRLLLALDVNIPQDNGLNYGTGLEYRIPISRNCAVAVRSGYNSLATEMDGLNGYRMGLGCRWRFLDIDYAIAPMGELGVTHRMSLVFSFR